MEVNDIVQAQLHFSAPLNKSSHRHSAGIVSQLIRMRFQIMGGLALGSFLPAWWINLYDGGHNTTWYLSASLFSTALAFLAGFYIFRQVASFPGVRATSYILPAFGASYIALGAAMVLLRADFSRMQLSLSFVLTVAFLYAVYFLVRRVRRPVLSVVAAGKVASLFEIGTVEWKVLRSPQDADASAAIVADLSADLSDEWLRFIADCALIGRPVYNVKHVIESLTGCVQVEKLSENAFGTLAPNAIYASAKRYIDTASALVALTVCAIPMIALAWAIRLESNGPALFRQQRMGHRGRLFTIYKFRTMHLAVVKDDADDQHLHDSLRITRIGAVLRKLRLDELPQLINIIRGEMSWIGPRPEAISLSTQYENVLPFYRYRHVVRPGISGWAQVHQGHVVGDESARLKLQYDFFYIRHFSLWLDLLVAIKTIRVVLTGFGAR